MRDEGDTGDTPRVTVASPLWISVAECYPQVPPIRVRPKRAVRLLALPQPRDRPFGFQLPQMPLHRTFGQTSPVREISDRWEALLGVAVHAVSDRERDESSVRGPMFRCEVQHHGHGLDHGRTLAFRAASVASQLSIWATITFRFRPLDPTTTDGRGWSARRIQARTTLWLTPIRSAASAGLMSACIGVSFALGVSD